MPDDHPPAVTTASEAVRDVHGRLLRDLRVSVTDRCNFRCPYCMPAEVFDDAFPYLDRSDVLSYEEIARVVAAATELGVDKVRLTGGEPLLRRDLPELVRMLAALPITDLALTTNGMLLAASAEALATAGLDRVTVSLDSLDPAVFARMSGGRGDPETVLSAIDAARTAGLGPLKVNCVVRRGVNDASVLDLARHFRGTDVVVRFIEFMDVGTRNGWDRSSVVPSEEVLDQISAHFELEALPPDRPGEVATRYRYLDGAGEIGVISSVTAPFCGSCTRARLTADGKFVTCLFASQGMDVRAALRSGADHDDLRDLLASRWHARADRYSELRHEETAADRPKLEMYRLGG